MKKKLIYLPFLALIAIVFNACMPVETPDEVLLVGDWTRDYDDDGVTKTEFYEYSADNTGLYWNPSENVLKTDSQKFTWSLDKSDLTRINIFKNGTPGSTESFTITELTESILKYEDDFGVKYSFDKVE
ncbi:MAG: hypothetical protein PHH37_10610 [Paludibacter sp.]|nr:hypothetical protein [Paludibacter sp.]